MGLIVPPSDVPMTIYKGATFRASNQWRYGSDEATATPVDLSGAQAYAHIRAKTDSPDPPMLELSTENGGITLTADGWIHRKIEAEETAKLTGRKAVWGLKVVWPDKDICRLMEGTVELSSDRAHKKLEEGGP